MVVGLSISELESDIAAHSAIGKEEEHPHLTQWLKGGRRRRRGGEKFAKDNVKQVVFVVRGGCLAARTRSLRVAEMVDVGRRDLKAGAAVATQPPPPPCPDGD